ncbi:hypothetical protein DVH24_016348 [Malus domestica]|uniref:Uncharacterized protein n=1 Tax=Malus domestica TaxID=3750 RepID=A0A498HPZ9_MALDO|nr:hypothetical protein DVH24_016348 [Malus domestica]
MSSQKKNREGVVGAQSGQYRATVVEWAQEVHEAFWELISFGFHRNFEVKRVARESTPMMGDPLGSSRVSSQKQNREGIHEAFWKLIGFGVHWNSEVKRVPHESTPMMGDPLGSSRVSSQNQNREGVVRAQSGQYRVMAMERARDMVDLGSGCDNLISEPNPGCGVPRRIVRSHIAHESDPYIFGVHQNSEVKRVAHESTPMMGDPLKSSRVSSQKQNREGVVGAGGAGSGCCGPQVGM